MAAQLVAPAFAKHAKRARELNDRETKDIYHQPTERGVARLSIDLSSPRPMSEAGSTPKPSSKERWLEAYLIQEAKRNNWMLRFGEKQYKIQYGQGEEKGNRLHYSQCAARQYRALYSGNGQKRDGLQYVRCGKKRYRAEYGQKDQKPNGLCYLEYEEMQYKAQYPQNGERRASLRYVKCGEKQYRFLCSQLDLDTRRGETRNGDASLDLLMYDESGKNLVILELRNRRALNRANEELDALNASIRGCKAELKKAFDLDEIRGIVSYVVRPSNGKKSIGAAESRSLGRYGVIEYPDIAKPWQAFGKPKKEGNKPKLKFTCRKPAEPIPLA